MIQLSVSVLAGFVLGLLAALFLLREPISEEALQILKEDFGPKIVDESRRDWEATLWMNRALELSRDQMSFSEASSLDELECAIQTRMHNDYVKLKNTWESDRTSFDETSSLVIENAISEMKDLGERPSCISRNHE